mmetsp:Transcript_2197/g.6734  ORF Transcript_2197/g.6734 Transcript_2197/m.6734 type:complete len:120 (+) Transcript_2197:192-551(+)
MAQSAGRLGGTDPTLDSPVQSPEEKTHTLTTHTNEPPVQPRLSASCPVQRVDVTLSTHLSTVAIKWGGMGPVSCTPRPLNPLVSPPHPDGHQPTVVRFRSRNYGCNLRRLRPVHTHTVG